METLNFAQQITAPAAGLLGPAVEAEQAATDLLGAFQPSADQRENYLFFLARGLFNLARQLVAAQRPAEAAGPARVSVVTYRQLTAVASNPQYLGFLVEAEQLAATLDPDGG
jgi:hypothetical protein